MGNNNCHSGNKPGKCNLTYLHRIAKCFTLSKHSKLNSEDCFYYYKVLILRHKNKIYYYNYVKQIIFVGYKCENKFRYAL